MNKHPIALLCLTIVALAHGFAHATEIKPAPLPPPPLISNVPAGISWTMKHQGVSDLPAGQKPPSSSTDAPETKDNNAKLTASITYEYDGEILREEMVRRNGEKQIRYFLKGLVVAPDPDGVYLAEPISSVYEDEPFHPAVFNEFAWISPQTFAGETLYNGIPCYVYRQTRIPSANRPAVVVRAAFVAKDTRLPAGLEDDYGARIYRFQDKRTKIELPPPVLEALHQRALEAKKPNPTDRYNIPQ